VYSTPPGTHGTPNATILSAAYNGNVDDVATDLNTPRPIVAGGTGATTPAGAVTALGAVAKAGDTMTGHLTLPVTPAAANAVRKDYVDAADALKVAKAGDTMSGSLTINNQLVVTGSATSGADITGKVWHRGNNAPDWGSVFTAPGYGLQIQAGTGSGNISFCVNNAASNLTYFSVRGDGDAQFHNNVTVGVNGNIYLGNNYYGPWAGRINLNLSPQNSIYGITFRPDVDTNSNPCLFANAAGGGVGSITTTGGGTAFNTSSDERLKEGFETFDAGRIVDDTQVWSFRWKSSGERSYGVSAQQAQQVYPEAVTYLDEQDWYGIDYSKYVPVLLQELKTLRARVAALEGGTAAKPSRQ
jgi:hypothetical protein